MGEIVVSGSGVMLGFYNQPEATAEALRGGWMRTGDSGRMDERGYVTVVDRIKDMIISGGENIYSVEVESAIALHPRVAAAAAVIGIPDADRGERVHAVVILTPGSELELTELQAHTREHIAGYKVPRSLQVVAKFPLSGAGKVLKRDLRAQFVNAG